MNRLIAFDPGSLRLRSALRIVVTMVVSLALLAALTGIVGQSVTVAMLGMLEAIQVAPVAGLATLAGTLLSSNRWYWAVLCT